MKFPSSKNIQENNYSVLLIMLFQKFIYMFNDFKYITD